jgi:Spy/CpxP family protein refolding chaperone
MKATFRQLAILTAATALIWQAAMADTPSTTKPAAPSGFISIPGVGMGTYEEFFKVCEVRPDQRKKITEIEAVRQEAAKEKQAVYKAAQEAIQKAYQNKDNAAWGKASVELRDAGTAVGEYLKKAQVEIMAVLTKEQKAKWQEYTTLKSIKFWFADVNLSDEQWNKIMEAYERLAKDATLHPEEIMFKLNEKVAAILTLDQKADRSFRMRFGQMSKVCKFTDEQLKKIHEIEKARVKETDQWQNDNADKIAKLQKSMQDPAIAHDQDALAEIQQQWMDMYKPLNEINKRFDDKVLALLTDKQKAAWKEQLNSWQKAGGRPLTGRPAPDGGMVYEVPEN